MLDSSKILVTGGAGFIGSSIVWALNQRGYENIIIADFLERSEKWKNLVPLRFRDYVEADRFITSLDQFDDITHVFHLGACSATTETDAAYLIRNNFEYTKTLAEWCVRRKARFVYASSAATYGSLEENLSESREMDSLRPLNMYGYSKHLFDLWAKRAGCLDKITGLKYFNVFGPNEDHKGDMRSMVHKAYHQIRESGKVRLFKSHRPEFGDGEQRRDFLYIKDAVKMTIHLAETPEATGLVNVGSGIAHSWVELMQAVFAAMKLPANIEFVDMPEHLKGKYQYFTKAEVAHFRSTGYQASLMTLNDAVADYVVNYLIPERHLGDELAVSASGSLSK